MTAPIVSTAATVWFIISLMIAVTSITSITNECHLTTSARLFCAMLCALIAALLTAAVALRIPDGPRIFVGALFVVYSVLLWSLFIRETRAKIADLREGLAGLGDAIMARSS